MLWEDVKTFFWQQVFIDYSKPTTGRLINHGRNIWSCPLIPAHVCVQLNVPPRNNYKSTTFLSVFLRLFVSPLWVISLVCVRAVSIARSLRSDEYVLEIYVFPSLVGELALITFCLLWGWCDPAAAVCARSLGTNRLFDLSCLRRPVTQSLCSFPVQHPPSLP